MMCPHYQAANGPEYWRRICSTTQAAEIMRVSPQTVRNLIESGKLVARRYHRNWQIPRLAIEALLMQTFCTNCTNSPNCTIASR